MNIINNNPHKVLIVSEYFPPDIAAASGRVMGELAEDLAEYGLDVTVYAGLPSYHGIKDAPRFEREDNLKIRRFGFIRFHKKYFWGRIINYFSFTFNVSLRLLSLKEFDSILVVSSPPFLALAGFIAKKFNRRINYIYLIHDLFPEIPVALGVLSSRSVIARTMCYLNRKTFKAANHIVVLGENMKTYLNEKYAETAGKLKVITNWADISKITPGQHFSPSIVKGKYLLYSGNIGYRNLDLLLQIAKKTTCIVPDLKVVLSGDGIKKDQLITICKNENLKNVEFVGFLEQDEYAVLLQNALILYLSMGKGLGRFQVPSKAYYYYAAAKPIIAVMDKECDIAGEIIENKCGFVFRHHDLDMIAEAVIELYENQELRDMMSQNAKKLYSKKYARKKVTSKFIELIGSAAC